MILGRRPGATNATGEHYSTIGIMTDRENQQRRPAREIVAELDDGIAGRADIDVWDTIFELLDDHANSFELALREAGVDDTTIMSVRSTVADYTTNTYT